MRPKDADALAFKIMCVAPEDAFAELQQEFDFILASLHYAGELDEEFFVPDAPDDKVLSAKDAAQAAGTKKPFSWLMPVALIMMVFFMFRRRKDKEKPAA